MRIQRRTWIRFGGVSLFAGLGLALLVGLWPSRAAHATFATMHATIDFGHSEDRVTIKGWLNGVPPSTSTAHFTVRVIITDVRDPLNPIVHDSGENPPNVVR